MSVKEYIRAIVNSRNRLNPLTETSHNFTISFNSGATRISEIMVERVEIPYSFYAINSSNNVLTFNSGANSITLTPGNYTATTLINELNTKLGVAFAGQAPAATFSSATLKLTITKTSAFVIDSYKDVPASTASYALGFHNSTASGTTATASSAMNISGPNYILVTSTYLTKPLQHKTMFSSATYSNVFWAVPVNVSFGDMILDTPKLPVKFGKNAISSSDIIDIQLYDDQKNPLNLNGLDWSLQLILITS